MEKVTPGTLTPRIADLRARIAGSLYRLGALGEDGYLPDGETTIPDIVPADGGIAIENIRQGHGADIAQRIIDILTTNIQNDPWSRRTEEANNRIPDGNGGRFGNHSAWRGPGRYSR